MHPFICPSLHLSVCPERYYLFNHLRLPYIDRKFGDEMQRTTRQGTIQYGLVLWSMKFLTLSPFGRRVVIVACIQCMTWNIFKDRHYGYLNLKMCSPVKFCQGHIFQWYWKNLEVSIPGSHVGYEILRSHSPKEFFIALAIGLQLKSNTVHLSVSPSVYHPC